MRFGFIAGKAQKSFDCLAERAAQRGHSVEHIPLPDLAISSNAMEVFVNECADNYDTLHYYAGLADPIGVAFGKVCIEKNIPLLNNRANISGLIHDKLHQALTFSKFALPIPRTEFTRKPNWDILTTKIGSPVIAKRVRGTHGTHVHKIINSQELAEISEPSSYLFQEFIPHTNDVRVLVLRGKAICGYQRVPADDDFRANLARGGYARALATETEKRVVFELAEKAAQATELDLAGVDLIQKPDGSYVLIEININPSWYGIQDLVDTSFEDVLLDEYEQMASQ